MVILPASQILLYLSLGLLGPTALSPSLHKKPHAGKEQRRWNLQKWGRKIWMLIDGFTGKRNEALSSVLSGDIYQQVEEVF